MAGRELTEESVKLRDNLVKSLRGSAFGIEPHVIKEFIVSTNNYLNDVADTRDRAEKMCGKTLADEELKEMFLKKFNDYISCVHKIVKSGCVQVYNEAYNRFDIEEVNKDAVTEILRAAQDRLNEYQEISFLSAEQKARSAGTLVERGRCWN